MSLVLQTKRLKLRAFLDSDIENFSAYRSDAEVAKYQGWDVPYSIEEAIQLISENNVFNPGTPGVRHQIAIEHKEEGNLIGDCYLHILAKDAKQAEIGVTISRTFQGQGYATEAVTRLIDYLFDELHLHRVRAICDDENLASIKLLEKIGMRQEAHFVENVWFKGNWGSEYAYAVLQREWAKLANLS